MRCPHYKRKPGESRLLWKEHLKRGTKRAHSWKKSIRSFGCLTRAMKRLGMTSSEAASAFNKLSDAWLRGGNYGTSTKAGLAMIEPPKSIRERKDI